MLISLYRVEPPIRTVLTTIRILALVHRGQLMDQLFAHGHSIQRVQRFVVISGDLDVVPPELFLVFVDDRRYLLDPKEDDPHQVDADDVEQREAHAHAAKREQFDGLVVRVDVRFDYGAVARVLRPKQQTQQRQCPKNTRIDGRWQQ